ncbi:tRNA delta(2)-isopentenylpyrophosphate transferase [Luminiphilus syltensis NOR5-1B]|uniref:tRNA dimethylallyltransferase n=2 Tax=Luminiphilus TaxID=1341118 RepID=B8KW63_9GAMM|nr:tRNA delta(2)-isopentenylpyrophosphate transferase [Luminiphilus syltensis NOR5-1B]
MGPTAIGKTALAIDLAERLDGELVSVDSTLVYRGFDIGTAKPDYPHHLVDIREPDDPYNAAQFATDASAVIRQINERGKLAILVGGSMLYFRAMLYGLDDMPASDPRLRAEIESDAQAQGWPALHERLAQLDPVLAARLHPNHSQRISRGLEVVLLTGRPLSEWQSGGRTSGEFDFRSLSLEPALRADLHQRIATRFDAMLASGLLDEVRNLHRRSELHVDLPAVRAVGYRQLWAYLDQEVDWETACATARAATRQLAKRQLTWLRKWPDLMRLTVDQSGKLYSTLSGGKPLSGDDLGSLCQTLLISPAKVLG